MLYRIFVWEVSIYMLIKKWSHEKYKIVLFFNILHSCTMSFLDFLFLIRKILAYKY